MTDYERGWQDGFRHMRRILVNGFFLGLATGGYISFGLFVLKWLRQ